MSMRALIIDDEPLAHKVILEYVKDVPFIEIIGQCHAATEAMQVLSRQSVDLLFLDINMPKIKGLDLLRTLSNKPTVIITSAYEEYALESFELDVCDYLLKPFRFERFLKAVNKALEWHEVKNPLNPPRPAQQVEYPGGESQSLFIRSDKRLIQIDPQEVYYLESYGNYVKVWLEKEFHLAARTLASFEEQLSSIHFFRVHKSYIINKKYLNFLEGNFLMMNNGQKIPIGKSYRQVFKDLLI